MTKHIFEPAIDARRQTNRRRRGVLPLAAVLASLLLPVAAAAGNQTARAAGRAHPTRHGKSERLTLRRAIYGLHARLQHTGTRVAPRYVVHVTFKLRRPVRVGLEALRRRGVVARAAKRRFEGRAGNLSVRLHRRSWPTRLELVDARGNLAGTIAAPREPKTGKKKPSGQPTRPTPATTSTSATITTPAPTMTTMPGLQPGQPRYAGPNPAHCLQMSGLTRVRPGAQNNTWIGNFGNTSTTNSTAWVLLTGPYADPSAATQFANSLQTIPELASASGRWVASAAATSHLRFQVNAVANCMGGA